MHEWFKFNKGWTRWSIDFLLHHPPSTKKGVDVIAGSAHNASSLHDLRSSIKCIFCLYEKEIPIISSLRIWHLSSNAEPAFVLSLCISCLKKWLNYKFTQSSRKPCRIFSFSNLTAIATFWFFECIMLQSYSVRDCCCFSLPGHQNGVNVQVHLTPSLIWVYCAFLLR